MIKYFIRMYFIQFPLLIWSIAVLLLSLLLLFASVDNSTNINIIGVRIPILLTPIELFTLYINLVIYETLLLFGEPFLKTIRKKQISLIISSGVSRGEYLSKNIVGMFITLLIYNTILSVIIILLLIIKFSFYSCQIFVGLFFIPFILIGIFIFAVLLNIIQKNPTVTFLILFVYYTLSGFLSSITFQNTIYLNLFNLIKLITPRIIEFQNLLTTGNNYDVFSIIEIIISFLPMFIISYYIFNKIEY